VNDEPSHMPEGYTDRMRRDNATTAETARPWPPRAAAGGTSASAPKQELFDWSGLWSAVALLREYFRLLAAIFAVILTVILLVTIVIGPTYTAVAIIGPPSPSPTGSMMANINASMGANLASRVLGGATGSISNDPYQEYLQLLPSSRLSKQLITRDHILQTIYYRRWDFEKKQWKSPGPLRIVINAMKRLLNQPVSYQPGVDDLTNYFKNHLTVTRSTVNTSFSLVPTLSSYLQVTFDYEDPAQAETLLAKVLLETDDIIREDQRHDVTSRISYIKQKLAEQGLAVDERTALISILSNQEQLLTVIQADQRYASTLVVPPYASLKPTSPPPAVVLIMMAAVTSVFVWMAIIFLSMNNTRIGQLIARFKRKLR